MATEASARAFFSAPYFAVVGASSNTAKFGYKIFAWYTAHNLSATPINPGSPAVTVAGQDYPTLSSLSALPHPAQTAVSFITPPAATRQALDEAAQLGIPAVWFQPGAFDNAVLKQARAVIPTVVAGPGGLGHEGWCVLVDGERALKAVGKL